METETASTGIENVARRRYSSRSVRYERKDMTMLYSPRGKPIGYWHKPSDTLFTMKCRFSLKWNQKDGPSGLTSRHENKAHAARRAAVDSLLADADSN